MNKRKIFREYAQTQGKEAKEFVEIISEMYDLDILVTKDNNNNEESTIVNYKSMLHWLLNKKTLN